MKTNFLNVEIPIDSGNLLSKLVKYELHNKYQKFQGKIKECSLVYLVYKDSSKRLLTHVKLPIEIET